MKLTIKSFTIILVFVISTKSFAQETKQKYTAHNKGKIFISFGGNRDYYTKSDIRFQGDGFDFTVNNAVANDVPKGWHIDYINPLRMTIPQTNWRLGYFINDHYSISLGVDHMKYVFTQTQTANVTGYTNNGLNNYNNTPINFSDGTFLKFEHTDGLNYVMTEFSRFDDASAFFKFLKPLNSDKLQINLTEGIGVGILYPRTQATVLGNNEINKFHVSGYGISAKAGLNLTFYKYFFVQGELKTGYINMPNILITENNSDKASQHFGYFQTIVSFGVNFKI